MCVPKTHRFGRDEPVGDRSAHAAFANKLSRLQFESLTPVHIAGPSRSTPAGRRHRGTPAARSADGAGAGTKSLPVHHNTPPRRRSGVPHLEVVHGLRHQRVALRPVVAPAGDQPDAHGSRRRSAGNRQVLLRRIQFSPAGGFGAGEGRHGSMKLARSAARRLRIRHRTCRELGSRSQESRISEVS